MSKYTHIVVVLLSTSAAGVSLYIITPVVQVFNNGTIRSACETQLYTRENEVQDKGKIRQDSILFRY